MTNRVRLICSTAAGFKSEEDLLLMQANCEVNTKQIWDKNDVSVSVLHGIYMVSTSIASMLFTLPGSCIRFHTEYNFKKY